MERYFFVVLLLIFGATNSFSQEKNQTDAQGRKQGYWEAIDKHGKLVYSGTFKDNQPVGEFKRYYPTGAIRVVMNHAGAKVSATFYWQNGEVAAKGEYLNMKRHGAWSYFSYYDKHLSYKASYKNGLKDGVAESYFQDGTVAERVNYKENRRNGKWQQFYPSGKLKIDSQYNNDKLHGAFTLYYPEGTIETTGAYLNGRSDGTWRHLTVEGDEVSKVIYKNGIIQNQEAVDASEAEFFRRLEEHGTMPEPTEEDLLREAAGSGVLR